MFSGQNRDENEVVPVLNSREIMNEKKGREEERRIGCCLAYFLRFL